MKNTNTDRFEKILTSSRVPFPVMALLLCASTGMAQNFDEQLLTDPGLDSGSQALLGWTGTGLPVDRWLEEDAFLTVGPQGGVSPRQGDGMICLRRTGGVASQAAQKIDVSALAIEIDLGSVRATASGLVNASSASVSGGVAVHAYDASNVFISAASGGFVLDGMTTTWEGSGASLVLPSGTRYVQHQFAFNNSTLPGSRLAYGDAASLVLSPPFTYYCNGDGGNQAGCIDCICGNNAPPLTIGGCINSSGNSARLYASGSPQVGLPLNATNDLRIALTGAPPGTFALLLSGDMTAPVNPSNACFGISTGITTPQFDGLRCCAGNMLRHGIRAADSNGDIGFTNAPWGGEGPPPEGLAQEAGFMAGQTVCFQIVFRDDPTQVCLSGLNTTQAVEVSFQ